MGYTRISAAEVAVPYRPVRQRYVLHLVMFVLTFFSVLMAGTAWAGQDFTRVENWGAGLSYAVLLLLFISSHEFGHYFAARYHGIAVTLPYYIPMPLPWLMPFGTLGALIRTRSPIRSKKALFDIGVAGPLAGFAVCIVILIIGFLTLPPREYLYQVHPEYRVLPEIPRHGLTFGDTLLFAFLRWVLVPEGTFIPPLNEIYHYPFLCVGWFGMFVTALNLLPIGQLDGGHILYAMVGRGQHTIGRVIVIAMIIIGIGPVLDSLRLLLLTDYPDWLLQLIQSILLPPLEWLNTDVPWAFGGWSGWLVWALLARFVFGIYHPPIDDPSPLDHRRMLIGFVAIVIFICSIAPAGIYDVPQIGNAVTGSASLPSP